MSYILCNLSKLLKNRHKKYLPETKKSKIVKNFTNYDWTNPYFCEKITLGC